ncbi:PAS domain S-box protein [Oscillatoria acuminata]|uniref:histidine kinase n=1 Tax=Oscillatoria acuminata PCC 6304 TaxID=56110 RepID=K9TRH6_9CYAN|nr:PAS domain S-box protein [Oscillatoria acuminata]AFY85003.1 PAS domain S-box [Oscillatoria acuminata PCC 6304]
MSRIFDEIQEGIVFINAGGDRLDYLNRAAAQLFGGTVAGFENQPEFWREGIEPQWRSQVVHALVRVWETETVEVNYCIVGIDGQRRDLHSKFWAIADDEGTPVRIEGTIKERPPSQELEMAIAQWFNLSLDLLCIAGTDGYFKQLNPMWETTLGYSTEELLSLSFLELVHSEDVASTLAEVQKLSEGKNSIYFENRYRCRDGSYKWMGWTASSPGGDLIYAVARDITDRQQMAAEQARLLTSVQESETRYRSVLSAMSEGVVMQDAKGVIYTCNQSAERILGLSADQMMGLTSVDPRWRAVRTDGSPFPGEEHPLSVTLRTGESFRDQIMGIHKPDGSLTWMLLNTTPLFRPHETQLYGGVATFTDISDRISAEALLRESEAKFRAAFEQAAVGIAHVGLGGNWIEVNQKFCDILGYSREELFTLTYQQITYTDDASFDVEAEDQLYDPAINTVTLEKRYIHKTGSLVWVNMTASMIRNSVGDPQYFLAVFEDISDRKQVELSLKQSQRLLEEAQQIAHVGNWEFDVATEKITWSKELFRIYDYDPEQEGPSLSQLLQKVHPQDAEALKTRIEKAITLGIPYELEHRIVHQNGSLRYVQGKGKVDQNSQGEVVRLFGTVLDITSRHKIEQELQEREQFLRAIWEGVDYSIFVLEVLEGGEFRFAGINPKMAQTAQVPVEKMLGKTLAEALPPEMADLWRPRYVQCVQLRTTLSFEESFVADGIEKWWLMTLSPLQDSSDRIDRIIATTIDISDRKQTELALQHSEAQYRELAQREALLNRIATQIRNSLELDTILDSVVQEIQQVMEIDRCHFAWYRNNGNQEVWEVVTEARNPGLINLIGCYSVEQVGPMINLLLTRETLKFDDINGVSDSIFQEFLSNLGYRAMLAMPMQTEFGRIGVISCACHNRIRVWKPEDVELLAAVCDQLVIALNQAQLYTQARRSAQIAEAKSQELQQTLQELQRTQSQLIQTEKMSSLGQLVAGVAHEINNPVNFIYGNLSHADDYMQDLLNLVEVYRQNYPYPTEEVEEEIEKIDLDYLVEDFPQILASMKLGANRIRDIVKSLRTFSRLDESDMKAVDLHENIDSTLMILQNRLKGKSDRPSIQVIKEYGPIPEITCYVGQINQVFMNILGNAIDAVEMKGEDWVKKGTDDDPVQPTMQLPDPLIRITTTLIEGNRVKIAIADNGIGMKPEAISKIFDPFYTTKPIGKGTGLGLAISYEIIVEKHRGTMHCISEVGKGTEFIIQIPLEQNLHLENPSAE